MICRRCGDETDNRALCEQCRYESGELLATIREQQRESEQEEGETW